MAFVKQGSDSCSSKRCLFPSIPSLLAALLLLLDCILGVHSARLDVTQGSVLQLLQQEWGTSFAGWNVSATDCSEVEGVLCDSDGHITYMDLTARFVSGTLPSEIVKLTRLSYLDLSENDLYGPFPTELQSRDFRYLSSNIGSSTGPVFLPTGFPLLEHLSVNTNNFEGPIPVELGSLTTLTLLDLSLNNFNGTIPIELSSLTALVVMRLESNDLQGNLPFFFTSFRSLQSLNLDGNNIVGTFNSGMASMTALTELSHDDTVVCPASSSMCAQTIQSEGLASIFCTETCSLYCSDCKNDTSTSQPSASNTTSPTPNTSNSTSNDQTQTNSTSNQPATNSSTTQQPSTNSTTPQQPSTNSTITQQPSTNSTTLQQAGTNSSSSSSNDPSSNSSGSAPSTSNSPVPGTSAGLNSTSDNSTAQTTDGSTSPTNTSSSSNDSSGSTGGITVIIIGVVAGVVLVLVLLVLGYVYRSRLGNCCCGDGQHDVELGRKQVKGLKPGQAAGKASPVEAVPASDWESDLFQKLTLSELRKATHNFSEKRLLGKGGFGAVYLGDGPGGRKWAVKKAFKRNTGKKTKGSSLDDSFKQEVLKLSRLSHRNLVCLLGYCLENGEEIVVYEYVGNGSLRDALRKSGSMMTLDQRVSIAAGVAEGLRYLHEQRPPVVHRDIKPDNILLDEQWQAKVADFGLLREMDQGQSVYTRGAGTPGYIDPDYWTTQRLTAASDVYSFGTVLLELITGRSLSVENVDDMRHVAPVQAPGNFTGGVPSRLASLISGSSSCSASGIGNSGAGQLGSSRSSSEFGGTSSNARSSISSSSSGTDTVASGGNGISRIGSTSIGTESQGAAVEVPGGCLVPSDQHFPLLGPSRNTPWVPTTMPLRAWVASVKERYGTGPLWAGTVVDPELKVSEQQHLEAVQFLLTIGLECTAWQPYERPTMSMVASQISKLSGQCQE